MRIHELERTRRARRREVVGARHEKISLRRRGRLRRRLDPRIRVLAIALAAMSSERASAHAETWNADEVAVARHCVSERSFAESDDCRVIAWIDQRNARRRGLEVVDWIARAHTRHMHSASRPWIAQLDAAGTRPTSWPTRNTWSRARNAWFRTLATVRTVLSGGSHGCDGTPLVWGSPRYDRMRLSKWYERGYARLHCGQTKNEIVGVRR